MRKLLCFYSKLHMFQAVFARVQMDSMKRDEIPVTCSTGHRVIQVFAPAGQWQRALSVFYVGSQMCECVRCNAYWQGVSKMCDTQRKQQSMC